MGPQPMISCGNPETSGEVVQHSPDGSRETKGCPESSNAAGDGYKDDESDIEPVDVSDNC